MKFRNGFVANSSSSSFLLGFCRKPRSVKELKDILFGDMEYLQYYDYSYKTADIAKIIFNDLKGLKPLSLTKITKVVESGWFPGLPDFWNRNRLSHKLERQFMNQFPEYKDVGVYWNSDKIVKPMAKQLAEKIRKAREKERTEDEIALKKAVAKYIKQDVLPCFKGKKVYVLDYDDETYGYIEHGDVFCNIPHIRISHH